MRAERTATTGVYTVSAVFYLAASCLRHRRRRAANRRIPGVAWKRNWERSDRVMKAMRFSDCCLIPLLLVSAVGWCADPFPTVDGENLLGAKVVLPDAFKGHPTVLVMGFTHGSQAETKDWSKRLVPAWDYYSVAVLEDVPRLVRGMAVAGIKSGVAENQRARFLLVFRGEKELKAAVGFERPDDAYIALLDGAGTIRWRFHGAYNPSSLEQLKNQLAELQKN